MFRIPKKYLVVAALVVAGYLPVSAQSEGGSNRWSLQKSIDYALANNLQIKLASLNTEVSRINASEARNELLPSLNGNVSQNFNFGRSIDPFENTFVNQTIRSNSFSLSSNVTLFSGLQLQNSIKQARYNQQASQADLQRAQDDMVLNLITAYMQILFNDELLPTSKLVLENTRQQLTRTQKLYKAGSVPETNVLEIEAQIASDELAVLNAQNNKDIAELNLMQLLDLQDKKNFEIEKPNLQDPDQSVIAFDAESVYETAQLTKPEIKAAELRIKSAMKGVDVARGAYYPRLTLNGSISSGYSSSRLIPVTTNTFMQEVGKVNVDGTNYPITAPVTIPVYGTYAFSKQFSDNISQAISLNLTIPIFNKMQARYAVSRSMLGLKEAELNSKIVRNELRKRIEQAYADAQASQKKFIAAKKQLAAFEKTYRNAEIRYANGIMNNTDFSVSKNNFTKAQSDIIQAKYDYIFKLKILDYYQDKPLTF